MHGSSPVWSRPADHLRSAWLDCGLLDPRDSVYLIGDPGSLRLAHCWTPEPAVPTTVRIVLAPVLDACALKAVAALLLRTTTVRRLEVVSRLPGDGVACAAAGFTLEGTRRQAAAGPGGTTDAEIWVLLRGQHDDSDIMY
jgi:hypothetical protein